MNYKLLWSDHFTKDGAPDESIWNIEHAGHGFGNNENQFYTKELKNAYIENGILNIVAYKEKYEHRDYTSAKLTTYQKKSIQYGRVEVMAKIPQGAGTWPAIWFLGEQFHEIGWPICGEIDLMEHVGRNPKNIHFSLHSKTFNFHRHNQPTMVVYKEDIFEGFHEYAINWDNKEISFELDRIKVATFKKKKNADVEEWPFNQPMYLILNLAIGGNWGGAIDDSIFPVSLQFKYVNVYERSE